MRKNAGAPFPLKRLCFFPIPRCTPFHDPPRAPSPCGPPSCCPPFPGRLWPVPLFRWTGAAASGIAFLPLLTALWYGPRREGKRGALAYFLYGWTCGVVFFGISLWWINEVSTLGYIPLILFYGGLFPGIWGLVMGTRFRPARLPLPDAQLPPAERRRAWKEWATRDMAPSAAAALRGPPCGYAWNGCGAG